MLEKVYKYLVERCFFTDEEAKEVCKTMKEINLDLRKE